MTQVTVYTTMFCPYCVRALSLLRKKKNITVQEIGAGFDRKKREEMIQRSHGGRTYPQIFIGDTHIGGCDEMVALERVGKLAAMLENGG